MADATAAGRSRLRSGMTKTGDGTPETGATSDPEANKGDTMKKVLQALTNLTTEVAHVRGEVTQQGALITTLQAQSQGQSAGAAPVLSNTIVQPTGAPLHVQQPVLSGPQTSQIRRLVVKLTEFNADKVDRWFAETERALAAANITASADKVAVIQPSIPDHIREVKQSIFKTENYEQVKRAVIKAVEKTGEERYRSFQTVQQGDRNPEDFLSEILSHSPKDAQAFQDWMIKHRFLSGLPADLAQHMQGYDFTLAEGQHAESVEKYVRRVNDLFYLGKSRNATVNSVDNAEDDDDATVNAIMNRMGKEKFHQKFGGGPNKGASSRQGRRSGSGTRVGTWTDKLCHIYKTHGDKAYSCAKTDTCPMAKTLAPKPEHTKKK